MDPHEARRVLGVDAGTDWPGIRAAHRRAIRRAHPDAGGSASTAARLNRALEVLETERTAPPAPPAATAPTTPVSPSTQPAPRAADVDRVFAIPGDPRGLLARLAEAGHVVGEVVFVDPHAGLLEIVVGRPPGVGQLAVSVGPSHDGETAVSFTLEPLGVTPAPPIDAVVEGLMAALGPEPRRG